MKSEPCNTQRLCYERISRRKLYVPCLQTATHNLRCNFNFIKCPYNYMLESLRLLLDKFQTMALIHFVERLQRNSNLYIHKCYIIYNITQRTTTTTTPVRLYNKLCVCCMRSPKLYTHETRGREKW